MTTNFVAYEIMKKFILLLLLLHYPFRASKLTPDTTKKALVRKQ
jgi:hypothetical protein